MNKPVKKSFHHFLPKFFLAVGLIVVVFLSAPSEAKAQGIPFGTMWTITQVVEDYALRTQSLLTKVFNQIKANYKIATDVAFKNSLRLFTARITKEVATQLAAAGPGQKPLFLQDPRSFFRNAANSAATDYIDSFSRGLTGQTGPGGALTGSRARFLISRSLRLAVGSPVEQCREDCRGAFGATKTYDPNFTGPKQAQNDYEKAITLVLSQLKATGGTEEIFATSPEKIMNCQYVIQAPNTGGPSPWLITGNQDNGLQISAKECRAAQQQAINNVRADSQKAVNQCLRDCATGVAGATQTALNALTAKDVFTAIRDIDPANAPAAVANALSKDKSDFGQLIGASSRLLVAVQDRVTGENTRLKPQVIARESKVSGQTLTPPEAISATLTGLPITGDDGTFTYTGTGIADILKSATAFLNSPLGKALANYFRSKCGLNPDACKGPSNATSSIGQLLFGSGGATGLAGAQLQFAKLGQVDFITGDPGRSEISVTDQLTSSGLIDAQFRTAIEEKVTVQEALDRGLLDKQKTFGFDVNGVQPTTGYPYRALQYLRKFRVIPVGWELAARYSQQFEKANLSFGFLTGQYPMCGNTLVCSNNPSKVCTVATATADCGAGNTCGLPPDQASTSVCANDLEKTCLVDSDCNGGTCGASPYCGLVDPNWVLKAPQTYCRRQGAGEEILSKEFVCDQNNIDSTSGLPLDPKNPPTSGDNKGPNCVKGAGNDKPDLGRWIITRNPDTCADTQSCIAENEDGTCIAYGYCVQEKDDFRFDGTKCSAENGTCTTYVDNNGTEATYLANTLDFQNCSAENAGCQWYCRAFDSVTNQWTCSEQDRLGATGKTINFTESAESCSATQAGCRQFIRSGNGTNILPNGGFETFTGGALDGAATAVFTGWSTIGQVDAFPVTPTDAGITANNGAAVRLTSGDPAGGLTQSIATAGPLFERTFTSSIRAKADTACVANLTLSVGGSTNTTSVDLPVTSTWSTFSAARTIGEQGTATVANQSVSVTLKVGTCGSSNLIIDSAQLEDGNITGYKDYGAVNLVYLNGTRQQCNADDVGCQKYTPVVRGPAVTGVVRDSNRCSADKVGCGTYTLEPIMSVPQRSGGSTNIVPSTARTCSAAEVGCEEYTNLDEAARGGEGKAYFKAVKQCVKPSQVSAPNPVQKTYYTWVGDPERGFVLRSYNLIESNFAGASAGAPCTKLSLPASGANPTCVDDAASVAAAQTSCSSANDLTNPNCAEYYDANLTVFYRLRASTISVTEDCRPFRNTIDAANNNDVVYNLSPKENISCRAAAASCRAYTGNAGKTTRQIFTDNFEAGTTANWVTTVTAPSNASVNLGGHSMEISGSAFTPPSVLDGKLVVGKTYVVSFLAAAAVDANPRPQIEAYLGTISGNTFTYSANDPSQRFDPAGGITANWSTSVPPGPEWNTYTLGPLTHTNGSNKSLGLVVPNGRVYVDNIVLTEINDTLYLVSNTVPICAASEIGCAAYRDANNQTQYLKSFTKICAEQAVGCEALIDTQNSTTPFAQDVKGINTPADSIVTVVNNATSVCTATGKGCEAFGSPIYSTDQAVTGFKTVYLKNNPDRHSQDLCYANEVFCRAYTIKGGGAAFFKDPGPGTCEFRKGTGDTNGSWFITGTNITCPTVTPPASGRPIGRACSPVCEGGERDGRACLMASDCPAGSCAGDPDQVGRINGVVGQCTVETNGTDNCGVNKCVYLAGLCPAGQNGCTEYRDPSDPVNCRADCPYTQIGASPVYLDATCAQTVCRGGEFDTQNCQTSDQCGAGGTCVGASGETTTGFPGCRSYFYIRETVEDTAGECNGVIDPAVGCRPFNDTSKEGLNFRGQ